jgi:hypothetical protein
VSARLEEPSCWPGLRRKARRLMNSSKKSSESQTQKFHVDPGIVDQLISVYNISVASLLEQSASKCDPAELQFAMARAAGLQQAIIYITQRMTEESKRGITIRIAGQRAEPSRDSGTEPSQQDRGTPISTGSGPNPQPENRNTQPPQPRTKSSRSRRRWF